MLLILASSCFSCKENGSDAVSAKNGDGSVKWEKVESGLKKAETLKKPVLMFFYTEWCIYCKKMDSEVFSNPEISRYMNENFANIRINPEKETSVIEIMGEKLTPAELLANSGSNAFPTILFFDNEKKPLTKLPGFIEEKTFLPILKYMKDECYKNKISLDDYINNPELCKAKKK